MDRKSMLMDTDRLSTKSQLISKMYVHVAAGSVEVGTYVIIGILILVPIMFGLQFLKSLPCIRSLPIEAGFFYFITLLALEQSNGAKAKIKVALQDFVDAEQLDMTLSYATIAFTLVMVINTIVMIMAIVGSGLFREYIFGKRSEVHPRLLTCAQFLLGPVALGIMQLFIWIALILQLIASYVYLLVGLAIGMVGGLCHAGNHGVEELEKLLKQLYDDGDINYKLTGDVDVQKVCDSIITVSSAGMFLFGGCAMAVLSQAGMLQATATLKAKEEDELAKKSKVEQDATIAEEVNQTQENAEAEEDGAIPGASFEQTEKVSAPGP
jgi:hypothetical protein